MRCTCGPMLMLKICYDRPKKLRFREHDETRSKMRRSNVVYRCTYTKCDKFIHNSRKCQSKEQDPKVLKER